MSSILDINISDVYINMLNQLGVFKWQKLHIEVRGFK